MEALRSTLILLDRHTQELSIAASYGLSRSQISRGRYRPGEGIVGKVVQEGEAVIVPDISEDKAFLNRTRARSLEEKISFICVPVKMDTETVGALSLEKIRPHRRPLQQDMKLLSIVSSMIARAVHLRREAEEEQRALIQENRELQERLNRQPPPPEIIGNAPSMREVFHLINQVAPGDTTVLIRGESGTGKGLIAKALHDRSRRRKGPFIKVNCAVLPESLIESELFGHKKGAFTGAVNDRRGRFEMAEGGTIFLDEIGELSPSVQAKLLHVLQEKEFEPIGGEKTVRADVRILTATNRNLEEAIERNHFREDLYYRLAVFPVHLPPLRERKSDLTALADTIIEKYNRHNQKTIKRITSRAIQMLTSYHWPGNVRELENCLERACLLSTDNVIHSYHLPPSLQTAESSDTSLTASLPEALAELEQDLITEALKNTKGRMRDAARRLGLSERKLGLRMQKYGIHFSDFRPYRKD